MNVDLRQNSVQLLKVEPFWGMGAELCCCEVNEGKLKLGHKMVIIAITLAIYLLRCTEIEVEDSVK